MQSGLWAEVWLGEWVRWGGAGLSVGLAAVAGGLHRRLSREAEERRRERQMREELEAYARLDVSLTQGLTGGRDAMEAARMLAARVCRTVAEKSVFQRVTMLVRNAEGRFASVGRVGIDDLTTAALDAWGESVVEEERAGRVDAGAGSGSGLGEKSFQISLGEWTEFDPEVGSWALAGRKERRRWRRGIVAPIRTRKGKMAGAIAVCADGPGLDGGPDGAGGWTAGLTRAMGPIEALAERLAVAMENEMLAERLLRAEKLAGLGQLAGGVAHALNNPLTAVLGFAELIAETSGEARVRQDAATIQVEALKMKETVGRLVEFWRPSSRTDESVQVMEILRQVAAECVATLESRGVALEVAEVEGAPLVRGSRNRLRQVMEHLLNNAAQAIATARPREEGEAGHAIRVTVSYDARALHVIVSDTGPGFKEPGRVFDPFYTTKGPEQGGAGMGLSICYGIVREHGGEISAFNLHPHGAAVVVELPVGQVVEESVLLGEGSGQVEEGGVLNRTGSRS